MTSIYTDGSSSPGGRGPGGWAFVARSGDGLTVHEAWGHAPDTTNNRMELQAIIEALRWAAGHHCMIFSDSQLCVNTLTQWARAWRKRGWRKADGGEPMNLDLVVVAHELYQANPNASVVWLRGHAGNPGNERADLLAGRARMAAAG